jgi:hypothetical protein
MKTKVMNMVQKKMMIMDMDIKTFTLIYPMILKMIWFWDHLFLRPLKIKESTTRKEF